MILLLSLITCTTLFFFSFTFFIAALCSLFLLSASRSSVASASISVVLARSVMRCWRVDWVRAHDLECAVVSERLGWAVGLRHWRPFSGREAGTAAGRVMEVREGAEVLAREGWSVE